VGHRRSDNALARGVALVCALTAALGIVCAGHLRASDDSFPFAPATPPALAPAMADLASRVLAEYRDPNPRGDLDNRFRLEIVAGRYDDAAKTLTRLRAYDDRSSPRSDTNYLQYVIYVDAKRLQSAGAGFDRAFAQAFDADVDPLDDRRAAYVVRRFKVLADLQVPLDRDLAAQRGKSAISTADALTFVRDYQLAEMYRAFAPYSAALIDRQDQRRYTIDRDILIATPDGAHVCAYVVRPRAVTKPLPALLEYSIYADRRVVYDDARVSAAYGYAGVRAYTPGKACSTDTTVPYEREGMHADAAIDWIGRQPWSDGRVGMFGGSYNSFAQWAAAKTHPRALRALMPSVANAPGIDTPMEGGVFESWVYPWPLYVTSGQWLDAANEGDPSKLLALEKKWYVSGEAYRAMDRLTGTPNPVWDGWLNHPSYDAFWQSLVPYKGEFGKIAIPALFTDGYLSGQNVGGIYYFQQYRRYSPRAQTYLVLGPYGHLAGQFGTVSSSGADFDSIDGIPIDPAAHIDIEALRYAWFDYVLRGGPKPAILQSSINYEVMHANRWEHAPSIAAMHDGTMRIRQGTDRLQTVNLADRSDVDRVPPATGIDTYLGFTYASAPLARATELNGIVTGKLKFICNKRDFDFNITLFGLNGRGEYEEISNYMARASYVRDRARRTLLIPDRRTELPFASSRITSWMLAKGSGIVVLVQVMKDPGYEINFGTGRNVSDETVADGKVPLRIHWLKSSFVELPVRPIAGPPRS
jgi:predicted acyl esterase